MIRTVLVLLMAVFLGGIPLLLCGQETIILKNGINLEEKMADNEVFLKNCVAVEMEPENNVIYFLDQRYCEIFKVDLSSGKLLKTIGNRGEGPQELHFPIDMAIKNKKIFVLDRGFNGIKIFDVEGKFIDEFRFQKTVGSTRTIDVDEKGEIFLGSLDSNENKMVTVFDAKGKKKRFLIDYKGKNDMSPDALAQRHYKIRLDNKGNIVILYDILRKVAKHDSKGKLLWEKKIKNKILDQFPDEDFIKSNGKTVSTQFSVFNMDIDDADEIYVGFAGGGCVFSKSGELKTLIRMKRILNTTQKEEDVSLYLFDINKNMLVNILLNGRYIDRYEIRRKK